MKYRIRCVIVTRPTHHIDKVEEESEVIPSVHPHEPKMETDSHPHENSVSDTEYSEYVKEYGYHFTEALSEYASKMMVNANGQPHTWSVGQVKSSLENMGLGIPAKVTLGDMAYAANMAYADFYPEVLKDTASCIKYAYQLANDPDGYDGMIFHRWLADVKGKSLKLNWGKFM